MKEFLRLVEEFVNMIGMQMSGFQDIYEVTENLGELCRSLSLHVCSEGLCHPSSCMSSKCITYHSDRRSSATHPFAIIKQFVHKLQNDNAKYQKKAQTFCVTFWVTFLKNNCLDA